ncbi:MAG: hypothetical protein LQ338_007566, partial [Usnochroma carphineum]
MFFLRELERTVTLHPSFFGPRTKEYLTTRLLEDVEGTCTGQYYIICVLDSFSISEGRVVPGSGVAEYTIQYRAVVWRPFKGETVDAIVTSVNQMGVFADVGPLPVFVSNHLIPSDIKWDPNATPPQYTDNKDQVIEKGTHLRLKLIGTRSDVGSMFAIGSVKEDFLGYIISPPASVSELTVTGLFEVPVTAKSIRDSVICRHQGYSVFQRGVGVKQPWLCKLERANKLRSTHESSRHGCADGWDQLEMTTEQYAEAEELRPLAHSDDHDDRGRTSSDSSGFNSNSLTTVDGYTDTPNGYPKHLSFTDGLQAKGETLNDQEAFLPNPHSGPIKRRWHLVWALGGLCIAGWLLAFVLFLSRHPYPYTPGVSHNLTTFPHHHSDKAVTNDEVLQGKWRPRRHSISWIKGAGGEDGLLLEKKGGGSRDYLVVEDVRSRKPGSDSLDSITLMKDGGFKVNDIQVYPSKVWPSPNLKKVLVLSEEQGNWRHSFTGKYWIFDVATQQAEALDPKNPNARIQLASWSPHSDSIVFTRDNNMFLRKLAVTDILQITKDGGSELFYGVPDWVYEEEVFASNSVTWWSEDGEFIAFLRTNETTVPEYPIQYFIKRPSGKKPVPGLENYPEVRQLKYPKAGAPNPVVDLQFYDVKKGEVFSIETNSDFADDDRLITEVVWGGKDAKLIVKETNRESDILKVALVDVPMRSGKIIRKVDVNAIDGGWFEVSEDTRFIPGDPKNGRNHDGYVDTVIHEGYDHLAYFTPLDNPEPILLTSGHWEVVKAPSAVDLSQNLVYFISTKEHSTQRHVYSVKLDGTDLKSITDTSKPGYYDVSFSTGAGYALLSYQGPDIPWQKVISTPSNTNDHFDHHIEDNTALAKFASQHDLPLETYSTIPLSGFSLNVLERRPPHFNPKHKYPVLFHLYGGPGSQMVDRKFSIDFQSAVASDLGYIVVTLDGRGTGCVGRAARTNIRGHIGVHEAEDQIAAAQVWAQKPYVDERKMAIWGWSYGGFMTLKTLELDAGRTFRYGMAVAPVTDWRFYDSIYTERYMHTPQRNPEGYTQTAITNVTALAKNTRFLLMHGVADDNVHFQNSLTLLDRLDQAGVEDYDVHVFPDSDHSIWFHGANKVVYD